MKKIVLILLIGSLIGGSIAYYMWNKPHRTAESEQPVAVLTAEDLFQQFSNHEQQATSDYLDKTIQVTGTINAVTPMDGGEAKITLATSDILAEIACMMKKGEDIYHVKPGMEIAIKGICIGYDADVHLKQSVIVK